MENSNKISPKWPFELRSLWIGTDFLGRKAAVLCLFFGQNHAETTQRKSHKNLTFKLFTKKKRRDTRGSRFLTFFTCKPTLNA